MRNICEFLPWEDNAFDVVIIGTSFDRVLLLDKSLKEIKRVLKPDALLIVWTGFVDGAKEYDPYDPCVMPVDSYHLFHLDQAWFEKLMAKSNYSMIDHIFCFLVRMDMFIS